VLVARVRFTAFLRFRSVCHPALRPSQPSTMPMKIAVAVILAIASAHNGINPKPTMDLDYVEIGPDAVKEDIPGADVFKKARDDRPDVVVTFKFKVKDITSKEEVVEDFQMTSYMCTGDLTIDKEYRGVVKLQFKHTDAPSLIYTGVFVQTQNDEVGWMSDYATREKNGDVSDHSFPKMAENYEEMQNLYENSQNKETKQTEEKTMKWTISPKLGSSYTEMKNATGRVEEGLKQKKKHPEASTKEAKTPGARF